VYIGTSAATKLRASTYSNHCSDASSYGLPWKIRRVKKHKLDQVLVDTEPLLSSSSKRTHHHCATPSDDRVHGRSRQLTSADCCAANDVDVEGDLYEREPSGTSSESLDSIVERILENATVAASSDTERQKSSKRRRQPAGSSGSNRRKEKDEVQRSNEQQVTASSDGSRYRPSSNKQQRDDITSSPVNRQPHQKQRTEKTLEDLFEEAVESLRDDVECSTEVVPPSPASRRRRERRLRSAENWERRIYDSELHDESCHCRLQTYTSRDVSRVSRGFTVVQKLDKKQQQSPDLEATSRSGSEQEQQHRSKPGTWKSAGAQCRAEAGAEVAYRQRVVITATAAAATTANGSAPEDGVDLGLDAELAANQGRRSSSTTWDSVSVDSLVMYDSEEATVQAATALYSSCATAERQQLNNEFVDKLRRLHDNWQQSQNANTGADDETDAVWVPMSTQNNNISRDTVLENTQVKQGSSKLTTVDSVMPDSRQPETCGSVTALEDSDSSAVMLADCVTSQQIVINIKLPRRARRQRSGAVSPTLPFKELRLRREIRFTDDVETPNSTSAVVNGADLPALPVSLYDVDDVTTDRKCKANDAEEIATTDDSVLLTADSLLGDGDCSTLCGADAEVEYNNKDSSRSVELVPVYDSVGRALSQRVDVSRSEAATRVVHLRSAASSQLVYDVPTLAQTVDNIRRALLTGLPGGARADGLAVTCDAVETVSSRGDQSAPVVRNIVVDCLPPHRSATAPDTATDDDGDDDDDGGGGGGGGDCGGNITLVSS